MFQHVNTYPAGEVGTDDESQFLGQRVLVQGGGGLDSPCGARDHNEDGHVSVQDEEIKKLTLSDGHTTRPFPKLKRFCTL